MNLRTIKRNIPFAATAVVALVLYLAAGLHFHGFMSVGVVQVTSFPAMPFLGIASVGINIRHPVGRHRSCRSAPVIGLSSVHHRDDGRETHHVNPVTAIAIVTVLGVGVVLGTIMGALIQLFALPSFLVTLAGMFFARGLGLVLLPETTTINSYDSLLAHWSMPLPLTAVIYLAMFVVALLIAHFTKFGRNVYAIGGNEQSAMLMGLPVGRTKIGVYAFSGFCAALAGVVQVIYSPTGDARAADGLELDAIAAVVVGGTLLTGGVGYVAGTFIGVLIFAIIQTALSFEGTLSSWWTRITVGLLLLVFHPSAKSAADKTVHNEQGDLEMKTRLALTFLFADRCSQRWLGRLLSELPARSEFPDALTMFDGTKVTSKSAWLKKRRPELKDLFQHYEYGQLPAPRKITSHVELTDANYLGGKATLKLVTIRFGQPEPHVDLMVITPNHHRKPAPVFLGMNFSGNFKISHERHTCHSRVVRSVAKRRPKQIAANKPMLGQSNNPSIAVTRSQRYSVTTSNQTAHTRPTACANSSSTTTVLPAPSPRGLGA